MFTEIVTLSALVKITLITMIKESEVLVIDDFISTEYQEQIKNTLIGEQRFKGNEFPWLFLDDVTMSNPSNQDHLYSGEKDIHDGNAIKYQNYSQRRPAFTHSYVYYEDDGTSSIDSEFHELFVPLLQRGALKGIGTTEVNAIQGRSFLQLPLNLKNGDVDTPHIDLDEGHKHIVVLYYVCDSDGDTIIYNEKTKSDEYTIKERVTPKQGRVVIFDGGLYHTAEQPINNVRCVVNYNLK